MTKKNNVKKSEKLDKKEHQDTKPVAASKRKTQKKLRLHSKSKVNESLSQSLMLILPSLAKHASAETNTSIDDAKLVQQELSDNQESDVHQNEHISKDENQKPIARNIHDSNVAADQELASQKGETTLRPSHHLSSLSHPQVHYVPTSYLPSIEAGGITPPTTIQPTTPSTFKVTINGTNDKPVVNHIGSKTVNEGEAQITGQITSTDIDHGDTATFATTYQHSGFSLNSDGSYTLDPTDPSFNHLAVGEHETLIIPVTATDNNNGQSAPQNLIIRIDGTNDKPVVSHIGSKTVNEGDAQITGQITATDLDHGDTATFATTYQHAGFTLNSDGSYTLDPTDPSFNHLAVGEHEALIIPVT
ncbi:VCBS domain-containing protein, partial [Vibrio splendidus]|uniref:VCBS domain-containing protein n=1 Tax=Vibrio splendidus TaxID=29497 RepID=UPI001054BE0D